MKNKRIKNIILIAFILTLIILSYQSHLSKCSTLLSKMYELEAQNIDLKNIVLNGYENESKAFFKQELIDSLKLKGGKLVFFFNENSCSACVKDEIFRLQKISKTIGEENILLIGQFDINEQFRRFSLLIRQINFKVNLYKINKIDLEDDLNNYNSPCYFILQDDFTTSNFYPVLRGKETMTRNYFKSISRKFSI